MTSPLTRRSLPTSRSRARSRLRVTSELLAMVENQPYDEAEMTFGEHLDELRKILIRVIWVFALLFVVLFMFKGVVLDVVFAPIRESFPTNRLFAWMSQVLGSETLRIAPENVELFNNKMAGQFMLHI